MRKMKTCKFCKHWRFIRNVNWETSDGIFPSPHGECMNISDLSRKDAWIWGQSETDMNLITQPTFGCNLWEKKEKQNA